MPFDFRSLLSKNTAIVVAGAVVAGAVIYFAWPLIAGDAGSLSRTKYAQQKTGIPPSTPATPTPPPPGLETVASSSPTPLPTATPNIEIILPPDVPQEDPNMKKLPDRPGLIVPDAEPETPDALPKVRPVVAPPVPTSLLDQSIPRGLQTGNNVAQLPSVATAPLRYLFNNLSPDALAGAPVVFNNGDASSKINVKTFSPMGETVMLALTTNINSNSQENDGAIPVEAAVLYPFYFNGQKLLDFGDRFLGSSQNGAAGTTRDRVNVTWNKIIFKDGQSLPVSAMGLASDGTSGIPGYKVGDQMLQSLVPILLEAVASISSAFGDYVQTPSLPVINPSTGQASTSTGGFEMDPNSLKNVGITAAQGALDKISGMIAKDIEENKPYLVVPAGTLCRAYLLEPMDTSNRGFGK